MTSKTPVDIDTYVENLSDGKYYDDPLAYVEDVFQDPRKPGHSVVPDTWQVEVLEALPKNQQVAVASGHGVGKAQPLDTWIPTPNGKIRLGDLEVGNFVFDVEGKPTRVIGVNDVGEVDAYRVGFSDFTSCIVSTGHLWTVLRGRDRIRGDSDEWIVMSTEDMLRAGLKRGEFPFVNMARFRLPPRAVMQYQARELRVDPYAMGLWLAVGRTGGANWGMPRMEGCFKDAGLVVNRTKKGVSADFSVLRDGIESYGQWVPNADRGIPRDYKYGSVDDRIAVLQGVLDGAVIWRKKEYCNFDVRSRGLADDIIEVATSLGARAKAQTQAALFHGNEYYRLFVHANFPLFRSKDRLRTQVEPNEIFLNRNITSIKPAPRARMRCITVESEYGIYQTGNHIPTHNSALSSWIIHHFLATRDHPQIVVTANTFSQLSGKTWRELKKWNDNAVNKNHFKWTATKFAHQADPATWFAQAVPWSEQNSEAFAGTHETSGVLILMDEASAIPDMIYEVAAGAMTTEGSKWVLFGNPTRNTGRFRECFDGGVEHHRWWVRQVDSRLARMTNKSKLLEWEEDYGEDSDFFRIRVRGVFPRMSVSQFISGEDVDKAFARSLDPRIYHHDRRILGVDVAQGAEGGDCSTIARRQGRRLWEPRVYPEVDPMDFVGEVVNEYNAWSADIICVDATGVGAGVASRLKQIGYPVIYVMGGTSAKDPVQYANIRTELWGLFRDWLKQEVEMEPSKDMRLELITPQFDHTAKMQIRLEAKKYTRRILGRSPDKADAAVLTMAADHLVGGKVKALPVEQQNSVRGWWSII